MITAYIALLRADGTEPDTASGYRRTNIGQRESTSGFPMDMAVPFPDVMAPGYSDITHWAMYDCSEGGKPLHKWSLPGPTTIHEGVMPVLKGGRLYKGVDIKARVVIRSADLCNAGGFRV